MKYFFSIILSSIILSSCNLNTDAPLAAKENAYKHHVEVLEVIQTSSYTYIYVAEFGEKYWMAVNRMDAKVGDDYYFDGFMEMKDFQSRELDRVFERILFVDDLSALAEKPNVLDTKVPDNHNANKRRIPREEISVDALAGGISIGELYENKLSLEGQKILVKGVAVKVNNQIMNLNWVHLQDGTVFGNDYYDLTVTTNEMVNVGDTLVFEGIVALDKDFGYGYEYELILTDASLK
jgi:hypothetical protein